MGYENVDHMATCAEVNGGAFGIAASHWAEWVLRGNQISSNFFAGAGTGTTVGDRWTAVNAFLADVSVTPLAT
jgi:hypothetical protein